MHLGIFAIPQKVKYGGHVVEIRSGGVNRISIFHLCFSDQLHPAFHSESVKVFIIFGS